MTPAQRAAIPMTFKCSLFDDLDIHIEDVFERVEYKISAITKNTAARD